LSGHDLIVIGGGLIGSAIGWGAARAGADVVLLDEGDIAFRAARGNFGLIWLQGKGVGAPHYMHWSLRAGRMWPLFASTLQAQTGIDIGWRPTGGLHFCFSEAQWQARVDTIARTKADRGESEIEMLDRSVLADMLPGLGPDVLGASFSPQDSHVSPLYLLRALQEGLQLSGGSYRPNFRIDEITCERNGFTVSSQGRRIQGRRLVIGAGLGAAKLAPQVGLSMPVAPERGQIVVTERMKPFFPYAGNSVRQSAEGSVLLGSSHEDAGFDDGTDVETGAKLCRVAVKVFPRLAQASIVRLWGSLRVMTPDGLPIYEESADFPGAFAVTCHSGVTLASIHALETGPAIAVGTLPAGLGPFSSARFGTQPS
jgi:glycine/D-amino acid oxidase-like deaminating enzyme